MITHLQWMKQKKIECGAVGFNMRTGDYHVFRSKTGIVAAGASHIFKPRAVGEEWEEHGMHLGQMDQPMHYNCSKKMTKQNRIVLCRLKMVMVQ